MADRRCTRRSSTWCASTARSWSRTTGRTTSASPPTPTPVAAHDDAGHVIYLRSLTKSVSPAIRVAAVIARGPARDRILADRGAESMYVSGLLQAAALDVVTQPGWRTHLRGLRDQLRARRDLLVGRRARARCPRPPSSTCPPGGLNLWLRLPDGTDVDRLARDCERAGVVIAPGDRVVPGRAGRPLLRLNYSGPNPAASPRLLGSSGRRSPASSGSRPGRGRGPAR